jgi:hypothetical protein
LDVRRSGIQSFADDGNTNITRAPIFMFMHIACQAFIRRLLPGNTNRGEKLCTLDLLIKVARVVKLVNNRFNIKRS